MCIRDRASSRPFVAATDAGPLFLDWNEVAAPDGTIWSVDRDSLVASSVTGDDRAETGRFPLSTAFVRSDIIGVDGAGRPVLRGPDLGGYVVDADGRSERIVEGIVLSVSPAAAVIVRCDDAAACELVTTAPGAVTVPVTAGIYVRGKKYKDIQYLGVEVGNDPHVRDRIRITEGNYLSGKPDGLLLHASMKDDLGVSLGDAVIVTGSTLFGQALAEQFTVEGFYRSKIDLPSIFKAIYAPLAGYRLISGHYENEVPFLSLIHI